MKSKDAAKTEGAQATDMPVVTEAPSSAPEDAELAGEPAPAEDTGTPTAPASTSSEKPEFEGNWTCADCGGAITSLPFQPRSTENLKCLDCFKKRAA